VTTSADRSVPSVVAITSLCGLPILVLAVLLATRPLDVFTVAAPGVDETPAVELGIGELEMGRDFGRPSTTPERGPIATVLLYGVLLLCPAKFVLLWALQRRESRQMGAPAGAPTPGGA
jgi:hypothetical protein